MLPVYLSLIVNVAVLVPVCLVILADGKRAEFAWGAKTDGRSILLAIYATILIVSGLLLFVGPRNVLPIVHTVLAMQVIYKATTVLTVGLRSPVVISNVIIAALHSYTIYATLEGGP